MYNAKLSALSALLSVHFEKYSEEIIRNFLNENNISYYFSRANSYSNFPEYLDYTNYIKVLFHNYYFIFLTQDFEQVYQQFLSYEKVLGFI